MSLFNTGIRPAIDEHIKKLAEERRDYGEYWSASSAGYCLRLNIMRRLGVPKSPELQEGAAITQRIFSSGHIFHNWIQGITKEAGLSIAQERELQDEDLMIRGHIDDLVLVNAPIYENADLLETKPAKDWPPKHLILYDYKTAHSKWFEYAKSRPMSYYNKLQLGTYMYMLRKESTPVERLRAGEDWEGNTADLAEARILKISKDDLRLHEIQLLWDDKLEKEVLAYWQALNAAWQAYRASGELPKCSCLEQENGFMGKRSKQGKVYGDFFYNETPCSQEWFDKWKDTSANL